ncbi:hypothetical protein GALL_293730 [mine drainage metagenome]|uniref:Uncharacterized protein n=1 Tax=mine drainage metagenome TaxID=410659 RepID=A0A1J5QYT0_9ZZZZ
MNATRAVKPRGAAGYLWMLVGLVLCGVLVSGCRSTTADAPGGRVPSAGPGATGTPVPSGITAAPAPATTTAVAAALVVGPGPSGAYRAQAQPAPGTCHYRVLGAAAGSVLPDPVCTPGARNPAVTPATLRTTICRSGYSSSIRPPERITSTEKAASIKAYAYAGNRRVVEYDHLISLELGGDPNDSRNLWPEPNAATATTFTNAKDTVENRLHTLVCAGTITLASAQDAIASNWTTALAVATGPSS